MKCWSLPYLFSFCRTVVSNGLAWSFVRYGTRDTFGAGWCWWPAEMRPPRYPGDGWECKVDW